MVLARARARDFSMGIGAARIEREHSCAAVERLVGELRQEVAFRDRRRKELEFLEKGGNPLDFEYGDVVSLPSSLSVVLSDSEAKEKKLFLLQNNIHPRHGILTEVLVSRIQRNGELNDPIKQVLRRGTLPSIVRVKEEKSASVPAIPADPKVDDGSSEPIQSKAPILEAAAAAAAPDQTEAIPPAEATLEKNNVDTIAVKEESIDDALRIEMPAAVKRSDEEILGAAISIKAVLETAARKPFLGPAAAKSHWDFVLEEMAWLANDFMQERLWKTSAAAQLCRSACRAPFWDTAEASTKPSIDPISDNNIPSTDPARVPLERYAIKFRENTYESFPGVRAPSTPDVKERAAASSSFALENKLHYIVAPGASEAYRAFVEESWASVYDSSSRRQSSQDSDSELEDDLLRLDNNENFSYATGLKKRKQAYEANSNLTTKKQRSSIIPGRARSDKHKSRKSKAIKSTKGTDSENEWLPDAFPLEKQQQQQPKRRRDQLFANKANDPQTFKRPKLSKLISKKTLLRKDYPGSGTWSSLEDQAILVLEHDFGGNWKLLSDILNAGSHIKGRFRSPKACQERHALLDEAAGGDSSALGIPKGSSMLLLQKLQGPLEHDTLKLHFEEIAKSRQRSLPALRDQPELMPAHESFAAVVAETQNGQARLLSPLDFPYDPEPKPGARGINKETLALENNANNNESKAAQLPPRPEAPRNGQSERRFGNQKPLQRPGSNLNPNPSPSPVKQEQIPRTPYDALKIEQQQQQQQQKIQPRQGFPPPKAERIEFRQDQQLQQRMIQRPNLQQKLPSCSTSQQLQSHRSLAEQQQQQQQHLHRPPQPIQQPTYYNNSRYYGAGAGAQVRVPAGSPQWRPSPNSARPLDASAVRLNNGRQSKQQHQQQLQQQQQQHQQQQLQQQQCGAGYHLPSSSVAAAGAVRYQAATPGSLHPAFPAKNWNPERPAMGRPPPAAAAAVAAANDPPSGSCK